MKNYFIYFIISYTLTLFIFSCRKNEPTEPEVIPPRENRPNLEEKVNSSITGYVTAEDGKSLPFAEVIAGDKRGRTDLYGFFSLDNANLVKDVGLLRIVKEGYNDRFITFIAREGEQRFVRAELSPKRVVGQVVASSGGRVSTMDGASVELSPSSVINLQDSSIYNNQVEVSAATFHKSDRGKLPGDGRAISKLGNLSQLEIYGAVGVNLQMDDGTLLQMGKNKSALINIPIKNELVANAPNTIGLFSFDETTGLWMEEGIATKKGATYEAQVSHFSYWGVAEQRESVNFKARIVDTGGRYVSNVHVKITLAGDLGETGSQLSVYSDTNGYISGAVFAQESFLLNVLTNCGDTGFSFPFTTQTTEVDLGEVEANLGGSMITITGSVSNCNQKSVNNGYVYIYGGGYNNKVPLIGSRFTFTSPGCPGTSANIIIVDDSSHQQSRVKQIINLKMGTNDLEHFSVCDASTLGYITYTFDSFITTTTIAEPDYEIFGTFDPATGITRISTLNDSPTASNTAFSFQGGGTSTGLLHQLKDVQNVKFSNGIAFPISSPVYISEYGSANGFGFIVGNFSTSLYDQVEPGKSYFMSCSFRVRRVH